MYNVQINKCEPNICFVTRVLQVLLNINSGPEDKMYGLILNNFVCYLQHKYGEEAWDNMRRLANIDTPTFSMHKVNMDIC
jgi:hypothetical protein